MSSLEESFPEPCPSDNDLVNLFCGRLAPAALSQLLAHAERCSACALVVAEAGLAFAQRDGDHALARSPRAVFAPGQVVALRYLIERRVGRGGMGEIYSALDQEFGDRVALKTICSGFASDPSSVDRFKLELRLARSISHPNVCRVFEFGRHELSSGASQCFFTLQFIEGVTLRQQLLEARPLELLAAVRLLQELASGLEAIHGQNVVHRDIKPENVMLPSKPGAPTAIWVDFGLARVDLRESRSVGVLAGTPDYAAPELVRGDVASRGSDLYAFGVMMYELLTGALPFARCTSFSTATERHAAKVLAPSALRPEIPLELDALVLQCLHESPELRPPSAAHVATRLGAIATRSPAATRWRLIVSLAIAAAGTGLAVYHTADPEDSPPPVVAAAETTLAPSHVEAPPAANNESAAAEPIAPPERKAAKRAAATPSTVPSSSATQPVPPTLRTLPDFGGRR
jgi:serine/threonine protein kinase